MCCAALFQTLRPESKLYSPTPHAIPLPILVLPDNSKCVLRGREVSRQGYLYAIPLRHAHDCTSPVDISIHSSARSSSVKSVGMQYTHRTEPDTRHNWDMAFNRSPIDPLGDAFLYAAVADEIERW